MRYIDLFNELDISDDQAYNAAFVPGTPNLIGKTCYGGVIVFLKTNQSGRMLPPIIMEWVQIHYCTKCCVKVDDKKFDDIYTTIQLNSDDEVLQSYFINIIEAVVREFSAEQTLEEVSLGLMSLIQIFTAKYRAPTSTIQGLWAELAVIYLSKDPEIFLSAWHSNPNSKTDFSYGKELIEVKSTQGEERKHAFSLDQLNPFPGTMELVASLIVRESGHGNEGLSVEDLRSSISKMIKNESLDRKLCEVIIDTLGDSFKDVDKKFFNMSIARASLKFYDVFDIPRIKKDSVPEGVSEVKFTSNLSNIQDISQKSLSFNIDNCQLLNKI